jgi:hypothetical protein
VQLLQGTKERDQLLDVLKFRSQRQELRFTGNLAWVFWIESNASEIMSNAQTHEVTACELLASQAVAGLIIHLPGPG